MFKYAKKNLAGDIVWQVCDQLVGRVAQQIRPVESQDVADNDVEIFIGAFPQCGPEVAIDLDRQNRQAGFKETVCQSSGPRSDFKDPVAYLQLRSINDAIQHMLITEEVLTETFSWPMSVHRDEEQGTRDVKKLTFNGPMIVRMEQS